MENKKDLNYWKNNAEEDYLHTPISVLKYIAKLEEELEQAINYTHSSTQLPCEKKPTFKEWKGLNSVIQHDYGTYIYKDKPFTSKHLESIYRQEMRK